MSMKLEPSTELGGYLNVITGNGICKPCLDKNLRKGEFSQEFVDENLIELQLKEAQKFDCIFCGKNLRLSLESTGGKDGS